MDGKEGEGGDVKAKIPSPTNSQKTISDDEEIDYSVKPEFYDSDLDVKDEIWVQKRRKGPHTDAVLSCPCCFTTLCLECQRHDKYVTQYRAVFAVNCDIKDQPQVLHKKNSNVKGGKRRREPDGGETILNNEDGETFRKVCCSVCSTEVGALDCDEIYHFFNALPSES